MRILSFVLCFAPVFIWEITPSAAQQFCIPEVYCPDQATPQVSAETRIRTLNWTSNSDEQKKLATYDSPGGRYVRARVRISGLPSGDHTCGRNLLYFLGRAFGYSADGSHVFQVTINIGGTEIKKLPVILLEVQGNSCRTAVMGAADKVITPWIYIDSISAPLQIDLESKYVTATQIRPGQLINVLAGALSPFTQLITGNAVLSPDAAQRLINNNAAIQNYQNAIEQYVGSVVDVTSTHSDSNDVLLSEGRGLSATVKVSGRIARSSQQQAEAGKLEIWFESKPSMLTDSYRIDDEARKIYPLFRVTDYSDRGSIAYPLLDATPRIFSAGAIPDANYSGALRLAKSSATQDEWDNRCEAFRTYLNNIVKPTYADQLAILNSVFKQSPFARSDRKRCIYPSGCGGAFTEDEVGTEVRTWGLCPAEIAARD